MAAIGTGVANASAVQASAASTVSAAASSRASGAAVPANGTALASLIASSTAAAIVVPAEGVASVSAATPNLDASLDALIETLRYQRLAQQIERGLVDGPRNEQFLKVGKRSKYRGM